MSNYNCTPEYWDKTSKQEPIHPIDLPAKYTQEQAVTAFAKALAYLPKDYPISMLKTDMWTEGTTRCREVLAASVNLAKSKGYLITAHNTHGMDISEAVCAQAREYTPACIIQADVRHLPYASEYFDLILDASTIDHVPLKDARIVLDGYYRCLKTNGALSLSFAHSNGTLARLRHTDSDYFTFPVGLITNHMKVLGFKIREEYAIQALNTKPLAYLAIASSMLHVSFPFSIFKSLEYSSLSKHLSNFAPLYTIIATKS
jgi:2-polyprenyl-3-methyl-5-hydroxy-6-metoxy-1,4-benzoquinol methylase